MIAFFGIAGGILNTIRLLPQVYKSWTTKSTHDLSVYFLVILFLQSILMMLYGFFKPDYIILFTNISPLACSIILLRLKMKYK